MDIYVINLDRQAARLQWMADGLNAAGVGFRRIRAIDGQRLSPSFVARLTERNSLKLTRFDVAVIMGHRKVWRALLRSPAEHCVVFEDDVHIGRGFADLLAALEARQAVFDIVKLESVGERVLIDKGGGRRVAGRQLCPLRSAYMGAAGYVVNRNAAAVLLRVTRSMAAPLDWFLFGDSYLASNGLAVLQTVPGIVAQEEHLRKLADARDLRSWHPARTTGDERKIKRGPARKVAREIVRPFRQLGAAFARYRLMRTERGLFWGRIGFE